MPQSANWASATRRLDARVPAPARAARRRAPRRRLAHDVGAGSWRARSCRHPQPERRADAGAVEDPRRTAVRLGDAAHEREAEARRGRARPAAR